jgi:DNA-binding transcriptional regulator YhcF (GntR family)
MLLPTKYIDKPINRIMSKIITFNELRKIKDQLPSGSIREIAEKLDMNEETVRNYFGGRNFDKGQSVGIHFEQGPDGGIVTFDDTTILDLAQKMINR